MRNICLWFCFLAPSLASNCSNNLTHGYRLDSFTTEILSNIGVHACINECLLRKPHCQSINYNTQHFQCGINSREADDIEFEGVPDSNSIFANILNSSRKILGTCEDAFCPVRHKCVPAKNTHFCTSTACKAGTYGKEDQCLPCPVGQYNDGFKQWCSYCPPGSYNDQTGSSFCKLCAPGTYMDHSLYGQTTQASCRPCPVGYFQDFPGKTLCLQCPIGSYQDLKGQNICKNCSHGSFQSNIGQTECLQCPLGTYQDEEGQISCKNCTVDTYQDLEGQFSCKNCSGYRKCTNPIRTKCHNLKRHEKQRGYHGYEGEFDRFECKRRCQENPNCRGFTVSRTDYESCHTHRRKERYGDESRDFFEYPPDCHP